MKPTLTLLAALLLSPLASAALEQRPLLLANCYCWYHDGQHAKRPFPHWTYPSSETNALADRGIVAAARKHGFKFALLDERAQFHQKFGDYPWFSTLEGNNSKPFGPLFKRGDGVDQFGRDQTIGPGIADGKSVWEHRIIGLASTAPGPLGKHGVVFNGGKPGSYTIYLDNLRIRHGDGSTTPLWTNGKDTRTGNFKANELFKDLKIRAVSVAEAGK